MRKRIMIAIFKYRSGQGSHLRVGVLTLVICLLLTACDKDNHISETKIAPARTILFYMGGDNNLSSEVNSKIEQLKNVKISPYSRVLIYTDTKDDFPQLLEVSTTSGGNILKTLREYPESNSADAEIFSSVLSEIRKHYPSSSYELVLLSHATGWLPEGAYNNPSGSSRNVESRSILLDGNSEMEIPAFAAAIPDGMFDFIVFEACYMASVEVAYELKDKTRFIVASSAEIVSPGFSRCYAEALPLLYQQKVDLQGFCRAIEKDYATRPDDYSSLTLSLIDTKGLDALASIVRESSSSFPDNGAGIQTFDRGSGTLFFDLEDCYSKSVKQQAAIRAAIKDCVKWKTATPAFMPTYGGFNIRAHCGLTTYIMQQGSNLLNKAYKELKWYKSITKE